MAAVGAVVIGLTWPALVDYRADDRTISADQPARL